VLCGDYHSQHKALQSTYSIELLLTNYLPSADRYRGWNPLDALWRRRVYSDQTDFCRKTPAQNTRKRAIVL